MRKTLERIFRRKQDLTQDEIARAAEYRQKILERSAAMERLIANNDFRIFCEMLLEDREILVESLLNENANNMQSAETKIRLVARINQIDRLLKKPSSVMWQKKNLTEYREAVQEKARDRQAVGNKTGG